MAGLIAFFDRAIDVYTATDPSMGWLMASTAPKEALTRAGVGANLALLIARLHTESEGVVVRMQFAARDVSAMGVSETLGRGTAGPYESGVVRSGPLDRPEPRLPARPQHADAPVTHRAKPTRRPGPGTAEVEGVHTANT